MVGYTSMALNPSNSSNLEQLALKGLTDAMMIMLTSDDEYVGLKHALVFQYFTTYASRSIPSTTPRATLLPRFLATDVNITVTRN